MSSAVKSTLTEAQFSL